MQKDIGAHITSRFCAHATALAGGTGDATEKNGAYIDRQGHLSGKLILAYTATLAEDETLTLVGNLQDASASDGTGVADYGNAIASAVVATGGSGGSTEVGVVELDVNLNAADRYVRSQFTPDLSASGTDTAAITAILVLGGSKSLPAA